MTGLKLRGQRKGYGGHTADVVWTSQLFSHGCMQKLSDISSETAVGNLSTFKSASVTSVQENNAFTVFLSYK